MAVKYFGQLISGEEPKQSLRSTMYDVGTKVSFVKDLSESFSLTVRFA